MVTTIQLHEKTVAELKKRKLYGKETYDEVIWDILEDTMELSEQTRRDIEKARKEAAEGKTVSLEEIKRKLKL